MMTKNRLKTVLFGYEIRVTAAISNGLVFSVPKQKTLKIIKKELSRVQKYLNLSYSETHSLWLDSYSRYMRVSKKAFSSLRRAKTDDIEYDDMLKLRKNIVYETVRPEFKLLEHEKNDLANEIEYRAKKDRLTSVTDSGVFYLCSSHINPAKDHAEWEGKIYVSADWRNRVSSESDKMRIAAYIQNHQIRTVEWVTREPVWMIFRPNCKHFFINVDVEEVLGNSTRKLLKKYDMYMEPEKEISYEEGQFKTYYERLKMLSYLKEMFDAENLDKDMSETRKLVQKWNVLRKMSRQPRNQVARARIV